MVWLTRASKVLVKSSVRGAGHCVVWLIRGHTWGRVSLFDGKLTENSGSIYSATSNVDFLGRVSSQNVQWTLLIMATPWDQSKYHD